MRLHQHKHTAHYTVKYLIVVVYTKKLRRRQPSLKSFTPQGDPRDRPDESIWKILAIENRLPDIGFKT